MATGNRMDHWYSRRIQEYLIEAGICQADLPFRYSAEHIKQASIFFYDRWLWETGREGDLIAHEYLEEIYEERKEQEEQLIKSQIDAAYLGSGYYFSARK